MRDIGKNLRAIRVRKNLTQDELAERLHVTRQTVSNYETGRSRPDVEMLLSIAEQLEVDVQCLLYGEALQPERRWEYRRLLAEFLLVLAAGILIYLSARWTKEISQACFNIGPACLHRLVGVPLFSFLLGWMLLHACGVFLGIGSLRSRRARLLRRAVCGCLTAYVILELPVAVFSIQSTLRLLSAAPGGGTEAFSQKFPSVWWNAAFWVFDAAARLRVPFILLGGVLWITGPARKRETT